MSDILDISKRDCQHLTRESTSYAIGVFTDTWSRVVQKIKPEKRYDGLEKDIENILSSNFSNYPIGNSRRLRTELANSISNSMGGGIIFPQSIEEPNQIKLEDLNIPLGQDRLLQKYYIKEAIPQRIQQDYNKVKKNLKRIFSQKMSVKVGYTSISKKYMDQVDGLEFIPLDIDLDIFLSVVLLKKREDLYAKIKEEFTSRVVEIKEWSLLSKTKPPKSLIEILLAFLVSKIEPVLCDSKMLHKAIDYSLNIIKEKGIDCIIGKGGWFRIHNAILATAGRKLGLPIIQYQLGGRCLYELGKGFRDQDRLTFIDYYFVSGWIDPDYPTNFPKHIRTYDPDLLALFQRGKRRYKKLSKANPQFKNILFSPMACTSNIFNIEHFQSITPQDMKKHRQISHDLFSAVDKSLTNKELNLFIKIKGFGYSLFKGLEYNFYPKLDLKKFRIEYLTKGVSHQYFSFCDLYITDSLATSFEEVIAFNLPTIFFWNKELFKIRTNLVSLVDQLVKEGIFVSNESDFKRSFFRAQNDPLWWYSDPIQKLIDECLSITANCKLHWQDDFRDNIFKIVNK